MKIKMFVLVLAVLFVSSNLTAEDSVTGTYVKKNGRVSIEVLPKNQVKILAVSWTSTGSDCNTGVINGFFEGKRIISLAATSPEGLCELRIDPGKKNLKLSTFGSACSTLCGLDAFGTMEGTYKKKSNTPSFQ